MAECRYSYFDYIVKKGDTYLSLAKKFSLNEKELRQHNEHSDICEGNTLKIPCRFGGCGRGAFYAIKKGDTLLKIAKRNGISMDALLGANPYLNPSYYIPGQVIVIPQLMHKPEHEHHIVKQGERLFDVLRKYNMDINTFCGLNPNVNPMTLRQGQRVNVIVNHKDRTTGKWYTLQENDDLRSVAWHFGVKVSALLAANEDIRPSEFQPGICVRIPTKQIDKDG